MCITINYKLQPADTCDNKAVTLIGEDPSVDRGRGYSRT